MGKTLYEKLWDAHVVKELSDDRAILFVDRHLLHEGVATYAFSGLEARNRKVLRPDLTIGVADHVVSTTSRAAGITYEDDDARRMVEDIERHCEAAGIDVYSVRNPRQGIVHVVGPELGFALPGVLLVCGDSHTSTHGAFGALAFGIGISEVEHVLATQSIVQKKSRSMRVCVEGPLPEGATAKDLILTILHRVGVAGGTGHVIEYQGEAVRGFSMEQRMTLCNMSIEAGARAGMVAPDQTTFDYLKGRKYAPSGAAWGTAVAAWEALESDADAAFDTEVIIPAHDVAPYVTWGTNPGQALPISERVPDPAEFTNESERRSIADALAYMGLTAGQRLRDIEIDHAFIGSCTNGRIEDLRAAAAIAKGRKVAENTTAWVVPGSGLVKAQAEREGLDQIFAEAGFEWREPGCSMCLAMNGDKLLPGQRSASTSNRNFEGRQGRGVRSHLMSPAMAAAAAVTGRLTDIRELK
ncbi:3-isopropylmalate dehydratase large subunit [Puniceibacterium sp. IMCC21224]|uniref:3-isopropylmalate dehydratase large subunit n=1 Tax=Puniceibacterium sp. IMCC21224 TaxID=1618204 RepID=UPI00065D5C87|nr:3-isopropylmalate dehydratase large subunit [Puniceibacterium sp. IMCC21224]KMK64936.1 3-isopropylmalate dehydratase, large subunit [Puniceibacterium sp. IMCC21224]